MRRHQTVGWACRSLCGILIGSVFMLSMMQAPAEAMLAPSSLSSPVSSITPAQHQEDLATIQKALEIKEVRGRLHALGLSDAEIQMRLSRLSDAQIHQAASQIRALHPAGEWFIGLLIAVLLVVLIIYLIKRL